MAIWNADQDCFVSPFQSVKMSMSNILTDVHVVRTKALPRSIVSCIDIKHLAEATDPIG